MTHSDLVKALANLSAPNEKDLVWSKGQIIPGLNPSIWRKDQSGKLIKYEDYGNRHSEVGWEIHHELASALGGADTLANKAPLHWRANIADGSRVKQIKGLGDLIIDALAGRSY